MSKKEEKQLDFNLRNYELNTNIEFNAEALVDITEILSAVIQNETRLERDVVYSWFTKEGKLFNGEPTQEQIEKAGLVRRRDNKSSMERPFKEVISSLGASAEMIRTGIFGFLEENIKNGKIKHKSEKKEPKMDVIE